DPAKPQPREKVSTGSHPVCVLLSKDQKRLYVSNSLSDTVSVIDTMTDKVVGTALLRPKMARDLCGATPTRLALAPDQRTQYAAVSDMTAVAVIDTSTMDVQGYISAGWYPTCLAVTPDGRRLLVSNAKGTSVRNPSNHPNPHDAAKKSTALHSV